MATDQVRVDELDGDAPDHRHPDFRPICPMRLIAGDSVQGNGSPPVCYGGGCAWYSDELQGCAVQALGHSQHH
jgi:hypothetical protein